METSLEHADKQNTYNFGKYFLWDYRPQDNSNNKIGKKTGPSL
jgi:hypothetical protein